MLPLLEGWRACADQSQVQQACCALCGAAYWQAMDMRLVVAWLPGSVMLSSLSLQW